MKIDLLMPFEVQLLYQLINECIQVHSIEGTDEEKEKYPVLFKAYDWFKKEAEKEAKRND